MYDRCVRVCVCLLLTISVVCEYCFQSTCMINWSRFLLSLPKRAAGALQSEDSEMKSMLWALMPRRWLWTMKSVNRECLTRSPVSCRDHRKGHAEHARPSDVIALINVLETPIIHQPIISCHVIHVYFVILTASTRLCNRESGQVTAHSFSYTTMWCVAFALSIDGDDDLPRKERRKKKTTSKQKFQ